MALVHRTTDTKLNSEVAFKVLPDVFAADPDRLVRFTREASVRASPNHPNIAAIYGVYKARKGAGTVHETDSETGHLDA
jgi:serine/threonine protein kinase